MKASDRDGWRGFRPETPLQWVAMPYAALVRAVLKNQAAVLTVLLLITAVAAALGLPPRIDGDLLNLAPPDHPAVMALQAQRDAPGGDGLVVVSFAEGTLPVVERHLAAAKDLRARI